MKNLVVGCLFMMVGLFLIATTESLAVPDYYLGDASVYAGSASDSNPIKPNILIIVDSTQEMQNIGTAGIYERGNDPYPGGVDHNSIWKKTKDSESKLNNPDLNDVNNNYIEAYNKLYNEGQFDGCLSPSGSKPNNCNSPERYLTGDYINWRDANFEVTEWKNWEGFEPGGDIGYKIGDLVYQKGHLDGENSTWYRLISIDLEGDGKAYQSATDPFSVEGSPSVYVDGNLRWAPEMVLIDVVSNELNNIFEALSDHINIGLMGYSSNNQGGSIKIAVTNNSPSDLKDALNLIANDSDNKNSALQKMGGALWDAWLYFVGNPTGGSTNSPNNLLSKHENAESASANSAYTPSPIKYWCQPNHIIFIGTGASTDQMGASNPVAALDNSAYLDDYDFLGLKPSGDSHNDNFYAPEAAYHLYNNLDYYIDGKQAKVNSHVIQLMSITDSLKYAAYFGKGKYVPVSDSRQIRAAIEDIIYGLLESNSSFVAPVVPASPENRAYSGKRIYLGFFKPMNDRPWYGNLKKFGLNHRNEITGFTGSINAPTVAVATDTSGNFLEDLACDENDPMPMIFSFWPSAADCNSLYPDGCSICTANPHYDGGRVDSGGAGSKLLSTTPASRKILTSLDGVSLVDFNLTSGDAVPASLETALALNPEATITAEELIHFVRGYEADGTTPRGWMHGDVMHSKPVVLNYQKFDFNDPVKESTPCIGATVDSCNKGYVFVGANDGMLHAYRDATGEEAWAFIPPDLLPNLQYLTDTDRHYYFVDNSPVVYVYDKNGDGNIHPTDDKAILIFGLRRGGGSSTITSGAQGSYHALDITDPENPAYLWSVTKTKNGDFDDLGQTWSVPHLTRMKEKDGTNHKSKVVAVIGAGYDNAEDLRYGENRKFPDDTTVGVATSSASTGEGAVPSDGDKSLSSPHGQGVYVIEVAELTSSGIVTTGGGNKVWDATDSTMYSMPSDPLIIDRNSDGYTDLIYIGDTDGQIWRIMQDHTTLAWTTTKIFESNSANEGRKVFYKPTATLNGSDVMLYFGTGDREHPLNTAVTDRFYVVRDRLSMVGESPSPWPLDEGDLVNVTANVLQSEGFDPVDNEVHEALLRSLTYTGESMHYNGWYINLENAGEKVLAVPKVLSGIVFFSTYQPAGSAAPDPCVGNLGPSRLYAVRAMTGEAVYNLDTTNDSETTTNERAKDASGNILRKDDRSINVGDGIASEPLVMINAVGEVSIMVGRGGGFFNVDVETIDPAFPIYWMKW